MHVGDLVIDGMPVIDYSGGGSAVELLTTIDNPLKIDFDTMITGHGKMLAKDDVRAYRVRCQTMNDRLRVDSVRGRQRAEELSRTLP